MAPPKKNDHKVLLGEITGGRRAKKKKAGERERARYTCNVSLPFCGWIGRSIEGIDRRMANHASVPPVAVGMVWKDYDVVDQFFGDTNNAEKKEPPTEANDRGAGVATTDSDIGMMLEVEANDAIANQTELTAGGNRECPELLTRYVGRDQDARTSTGSDALARDDYATKIRKLEFSHEQKAADTTNTLEVQKINAGNISASLTDIYGRTPGKEPKYTIACPNCGRHLSSSRLAIHLEKCMGLSSSRKNSVSAASIKKKRSVNKKRTTSSNEDNGGGGSKVSKQSQAKKKSKDT